jgi:hypothetical protein
MYRFAVLLAGLAACGGVDNRPKNLDFITGAILNPNCAAAQCHSAFRRQAGDEFDTPAAARRSLLTYGPLQIQNGCQPFPQACDATLIKSITVGLQSVLEPSVTNVRMPFDGPLANADVALIQDWISEGWDKMNPETNGEGPFGAQCLPFDDSGNPQDVCGLDGNVHSCGTDGNIGDIVKVCTSRCDGGACP